MLDGTRCNSHHLLGRLEYHNKDKKLLAHDYGLIYPVTPENIKEKMF
jgi:hypothetical protein